MKKFYLLTKTLLVAALLMVGANAWADATLVYGRAVVADPENGYTAWSSSDIGTGQWGGHGWFSEGEGIKINGKGGRSTSKTFTITENSLLTIDLVLNTGVNTGSADNYTTYNIGEDIQIWFNQQNQQGKVIINSVESAISNACGKDNGNRNNDVWTVHMVIDTSKDKLNEMTLSGSNGTLKASYTLAEAVSLTHNITTSLAVSFSFNRAAGDLNTFLSSLKIQEEEQEVSTADYTINYIFNESTIKTTYGNTAVGSTVYAETPITISDTKYYAKDGEITSMEISEGTNTLNVDLRQANNWSYTVKSSLGTTIVSGNGIEGESISYKYPQFILSGTDLYEGPRQGSNPWYGKTFTLTSNEQEETLTYTKSKENVAYYSEAEDIEGATERTGSNANIRCSNGAGGSFASDAVVTTLPAGIYKVSGQIWGNASVTFNINAGEDNVWSLTTVGYLTDATSDEFMLTENTDIVIKAAGDGGKMLDWVYIQRTGDAAVSKTIDATLGWATYCSPYALDFSGEIDNLTRACLVTGGKDGQLELSDITGTIPANTGILLEGSGAVNIPVVASSSTDVSSNKLVGVTTETSGVAAGIYVLLYGVDDTSGPVGFYKTANAFTIGANTAYLPSGFDAVGVGARSAYFFGGITGISEAAQVAETALKDGKFFKDGKLFIMKNGVKYNAAGAQIK